MTDSDYIWYDECFRVEEGILWNSFLKDGTAVLSTLTKEMCITETRHYLKAKQDGFDKSKVTTIPSNFDPATLEKCFISSV